MLTVRQYVIFSQYKLSISNQCSYSISNQKSLQLIYNNSTLKSQEGMDRQCFGSGLKKGLNPKHRLSILDSYFRSLCFKKYFFMIKGEVQRVNITICLDECNSNNIQVCAAWTHPDPCSAFDWNLTYRTKHSFSPPMGHSGCTMYDLPKTLQLITQALQIPYNTSIKKKYLGIGKHRHLQVPSRLHTIPTWKYIAGPLFVESKS